MGSLRVLQHSLKWVLGYAGYTGTLCFKLCANYAFRLSEKLLVWIKYSKVPTSELLNIFQMRRHRRIW